MTGFVLLEGCVELWRGCLLNRASDSYRRHVRAIRVFGAKHFVYTSPISTGSNPHTTLSPRPDSGYDARTHKVARQQILLAGYRLAFLLNQNLR
jgi:hypothetical protein